MAKILRDKDIAQIEDIKKKGSVPEHLAIIMDGNGRWAKNKKLPRAAGHRKGAVVGGRRSAPGREWPIAVQQSQGGLVEDR